MKPPSDPILPSNNIAPLVWCFVADLRSETSRTQLKSALDLGPESLAVLYDRALAVAKATGERYVAVAYGSSGGNAVMPLSDLRELLGLGRLLHDVGVAAGTVRYRALGLDAGTMNAVFVDHMFVAGAAGGHA